MILHRIPHGCPEYYPTNFPRYIPRSVRYLTTFPRHPTGHPLLLSPDAHHGTPLRLSTVSHGIYSISPSSHGIHSTGTHRMPTASHQFPSQYPAELSRYPTDLPRSPTDFPRHLTDSSRHTVSMPLPLLLFLLFLCRVRSEKIPLCRICCIYSLLRLPSSPVTASCLEKKTLIGIRARPYTYPRTEDQVYNTIHHM